MNNNWKEAFHFSQRERRGIFVFVAIIGILLCLPPLFEEYFQSSKVDFSSFKSAIKKYEADQSLSSNTINPSLSSPYPFNPNIAPLEDLLTSGIPEPIAQRIINYRKAGGFFYRKEDLKNIYGLEDSVYQQVQEYIRIPSKKKLTKKKYAIKKVATPQLIKPFRFDPNKVSFQELSSMNLPSKVVNQIINYRSKGGSFQKKEDLKKIYALSTQDYQQLAPFIVLRKPPLVTPTSYLVPTAQALPKNTQIDINEATMEEWQQLNGIGPYYAKIIVNFREKLGGFATREQVGTTYGFPDSIFQKINAHLVLSPLTNSLRINTISIEELKAHPYIKKHQAIAIVNYRKNHGTFDSIEKFKKVKVFSGKDLARIAPYLSFE